MKLVECKETAPNAPGGAVIKYSYAEDAKNVGEDPKSQGTPSSPRASLRQLQLVAFFSRAREAKKEEKWKQKKMRTLSIPSLSHLR